jgi:hypothetical protein
MTRAGISTVRVTVVFQSPTSPPRPENGFSGLVRLGLILAALGPHTGNYRGLAATGSRHPEVMLEEMPVLGLKISCGGCRDAVKCIVAGLKTNSFRYRNPSGGLNMKYSTE